MKGFFPSGTVIIHFLDNPYQQINFKSHLSNVLVCKQGKIMSYFYMPGLTLFHFTYLCSLFQ